MLQWLIYSYQSSQNNETLLLNDVARQPVNVNMDISCNAMQFYSSGILDDPTCPRNPNHCITAVGYGTEAGVDYWTFKNMFVK
jgi:hypothetical protein